MLADILHKIAAMQREERGVSAYYPRPSSAGPERCIRQMVYHARGEDAKPLPGRSVVVFEDSSWHEELTMDLIRKSSYTLHSEQMGLTLANVFPWRIDQVKKCEVCGGDFNNRDMHGHIDGVVTDLLGEDLLLEHKAVSHFSWEALSEGELPYDYLTQMGIYFRGIGEVNPDIKRGLMLVKNKNTSGYVEFEVEYDHEIDLLRVVRSRTHTGEVREIDQTITTIVGFAIEKFRKVDEHHAKGTLPARDYRWDHWRCDYCAYNETCWGAYVKEHQTFKEDVKLGGWLGNLMRQYAEMGEQTAAARKIENARKKIGTDIRKLLEQAQVKEGFSGNWAVEWVVKNSKRFVKENVPADIVEKYSEDSIYDRLNVKQVGKSKGKGDK